MIRNQTMSYQQPLENKNDLPKTHGLIQELE